MLEITKEMEQKLLKGELIMLAKNNDGETITLTKNEFYELMGKQNGYLIMQDCFSLIDDTTIYLDGAYYEIIHGKRMVINLFEEAAKAYVEAVNDELNLYGLEWEN